MDDVVLLSDPRIAAIAEPDAPQPGLVDLAGAADLVIDHRKEDPEGHWRRLRAPVADLLGTAAVLAADEGVALRLVEGFRPAALQGRYFHEYVATLRGLHPQADDATLRTLAARHVSPPEVAPHTAGAAVDVTLEAGGVELDLGSAVNATPEASGGRCYTGAPDVAGPAAEHRRLLIAIMDRAGFVNYPTEWWHWSYGDRYWAWSTGSRRALFGPA
ncbi:M15 family metallopeptidase [Nocardioides sp. T2.26MG-1]|uniref:M15 family metallopeptidase n=1 Tax=Nocardioides sp. T2.26MG-1 TaxID=3041166 RepID=UPI00247764DD|nr:M15 family metallopeptidase [Nocardioides sp. T2.26MG-1]CAI9401615.1 D-alanyl-D-alanine dipeptidase [Nocardioides sp. T2.26MG-1]